LKPVAIVTEPLVEKYFKKSDNLGLSPISVKEFKSPSVWEVFVRVVSLLIPSLSLSEGLKSVFGKQ
jgi:hypothetical protein